MLENEECCLQRSSTIPTTNGANADRARWKGRKDQRKDGHEAICEWLSSLNSDQGQSILVQGIAGLYS